MQINKTDNVVFLKEVESNIIDEAFIILKKDVKIADNASKQINLIKKDILKEAELIINEQIEKNKCNYEKFKVSKLNKKIKILRWTNIILIIILLINFIK